MKNEQIKKQQENTLSLLEKARKLNVFNGFEYSAKEYNKALSTLENALSQGLHIIIAKHSLKKLASKGNMVAFDLWQGKDNALSIEDLSQSIALWFCANPTCITYDFENKAFSFNDRDENAENKGFSDIETLASVWKVVPFVLYQLATKHYAKSYVELDGEYVAIDNVKALSYHADFESIEFSVFLSTFNAYVAKQGEKRCAVMFQILKARIEGFTYKEISKAYNVPITTAKSLIIRCGEYFKEYEKARKPLCNKLFK